MREVKMIEVEVTSEIWRTKEYTLTVLYPLPDVAYLKGFRGTYTRKLREDIKRLLLAKGVTTAHYERRKGGKISYFTLDK